MTREPLWPASVAALCASIDELVAPQLDGERTRELRPGWTEVRRLGLALEPFPDLAGWCRRHRLDALFLHRAWTLPADLLPDGVGAVANHGPFDERLGLGWNEHLAAGLELASPEPLRHPDGPPLGMLGDVVPITWDRLVGRIAALFGGVEAATPGAERAIGRLVVARAMTDALVREAARRGAAVYVTGQRRKPADRAVAATGVGVVAVGHRRSERWSLELLGRLLGERWPGLVVRVAPEPEGITLPFPVADA